MCYCCVRAGLPGAMISTKGVKRRAMPGRWKRVGQNTLQQQQQQQQQQVNSAQQAQGKSPAGRFRRTRPSK